MGEFLEFFKDKKNLAGLLLLVILLLAIPIGMQLLSKQRIIKSRASGEPIVFKGDNVRQKLDGSWVATKAQISLELTSPLGPPATGVSPSLSPTAAASGQ